MLPDLEEEAKRRIRSKKNGTRGVLRRVRRSYGTVVLPFISIMRSPGRPVTPVPDAYSWALTITRRSPMAETAPELNSPAANVWFMSYGGWAQKLLTGYGAPIERLVGTAKARTPKTTQAREAKLNRTLSTFLHNWGCICLSKVIHKFFHVHSRPGRNDLLRK